MSKADGWEKQANGWEWRKTSPAYRAEIAKIIGNGSRPYVWDVYPQHLDKHGRYSSVSRGSDATLAEAKARAQVVIDRLIGKALGEE